MDDLDEELETLQQIDEKEALRAQVKPLTLENLT